MFSSFRTFAKSKLNLIPFRSITNISVQDKRTCKKVVEQIIERNDFPISKCRKILKNETIAVLGYGPQGRGQSLNLRDRGFNVILGMRSGKSWDLALKDKWQPGYNLFETCDAADRGTYLQYLLSDAGQIAEWENVKECIKPSETLSFSHGFGVAYQNETGIVPQDGIDVVMTAPKGAGMTVRDKFLEGKGINASFAIHQDFTGLARSKCLAYTFAIGSGHAFETTFEKEVFSDLTGERCVLMGMIQGAFKAQYDVLRENGHSPSEAFNETVEEALNSLYPLINEKGMDWLYSNCSTTAQRGALDWAPRFESVLKPVIQKCYNDVKWGTEAHRVITTNSKPEYREELNKELDNMRNQEIWQVAEQLRKLRE